MRSATAALPTVLARSVSLRPLRHHHLVDAQDDRQVDAGGDEKVPAPDTRAQDETRARDGSFIGPNPE
jgi:hypothetical protein